MPDADTVWLTPLEEMLTCLERAGLAVRWQEDCSSSHRAVADSLVAAFTADAAAIAEQIGRRTLEELLAAHRLLARLAARRTGPQDRVRRREGKIAPPAASTARARVLDRDELRRALARGAAPVDTLEHRRDDVCLERLACCNHRRRPALHRVREAARRARAGLCEESSGLSSRRSHRTTRPPGRRRVEREAETDAY